LTKHNDRSHIRHTFNPVTAVPYCSSNTLTVIVGTVVNDLTLKLSRTRQLFFLSFWRSSHPFLPIPFPAFPAGIIPVRCRSHPLRGTKFLADYHHFYCATDRTHCSCSILQPATSFVCYVCPMRQPLDTIHTFCEATTVVKDGHLGFLLLPRTVRSEKRSRLANQVLGECS
jgi:hypothetical protein